MLKWIRCLELEGSVVTRGVILTRALAMRFSHAHRCRAWEEKLCRPLQSTEWLETRSWEPCDSPRAPVQPTAGVLVAAQPWPEARPSAKSRLGIAQVHRQMKAPQKALMALSIFCCTRPPRALAAMSSRESTMKA